MGGDIAAFEAYYARSPSFGLTDVAIAYQEKRQPEEAKRTAARLMAIIVVLWLLFR